jgi:hypothetical protein
MILPASLSTYPCHDLVPVALSTKCHLQDLKKTSLCANYLIFFTDDNLLHQESQAVRIDLDLFGNNISNTNIAHQQALVLYNAANALHKSFELIKSLRNVLNISTHPVQ